MDDALSVRGLTAGYGEVSILDKISFDVGRGAALAILGRNGVGKTTLLLSLLGLTHQRSGHVFLHEQPLDFKKTYERNRLGLALVPQEREVFPSLTVEENLIVAHRKGYWDIKRIFDLFPGLARRRFNLGNRLSGGEQQMLAIGRALAGNPLVLLLDEPFEGLAPIIVDQIADALATIRAAGDLTLVLVEHHAELALRITDQAIVLDRGKIIWSGASHSLKDEGGLLASLVGLDQVGCGEALFGTVDQDQSGRER